MSIEVEDKTKCVVLRVSDGVFIREGVREFTTRIREYKEQNRARFLVDFSQCDYISSEGLGAMSDLWKYCASQPDGKMVVVFNSDPENDVHYLFDTIGLSVVMKDNIFTDIDDAEKAFT